MLTSGTNQITLKYEFGGSNTDLYWNIYHADEEIKKNFNLKGNKSFLNKQNEVN